MLCPGLWTLAAAAMVVAGDPRSVLVNNTLSVCLRLGNWRALVRLISHDLEACLLQVSLCITIVAILDVVVIIVCVAAACFNVICLGVLSV